MPVMPFHLAIPVTSLAASRDFYADLLGCEQGRSSEHWIDWNFFGHQLVTHLVSAMPNQPAPNNVDDKAVPVPHFGVVLSYRALCAFQRPTWRASHYVLTRPLW